ncbi:MAG: GNAT family N-acetyltransferase [Candidatus Eremiobacteraeota bacterium]|nr:GNAT family N-acetyltransferase [Candidatus Eremiobacteraeota bacterium]
MMIRKATEVDFNLLSELERQAARRFLSVPEATGMTAEQLEDTLSREELERAHSEGGVWIAEWAEQPAGFIATHRYQDSLYIREVDVLQSYGRRGIGTALIRQSISQARALGLSLVFLRTFREVEWNAPFYEKLGFAPITECDWTAAMERIVEVEDEWGLVRDRRQFMKLAGLARGAPVT